MKASLHTLVVLAFAAGLAVACRNLVEIPFVPLTVNFFTSASVVQEGDTVKFFAQTSSVASQYQWSFGVDGAGDTERDTKFRYTRRGKYPVKLVASKVSSQEGGITRDSFTRDILVLPALSNDAANRVNLVLNVANLDESAYQLVPFTRAGVKQYWLVARRNVRSLVIATLNEDLQPAAAPQTINNLSESASKVVPLAALRSSDGGLVVVGYTEYENSDRDAFIIKLDINLQELWRRRLNTPRDENYVAVQEVNNQILAIGAQYSLSNFQAQIQIDIYSAEGVLNQSTQLANTNWLVNDAQITADGGLILAGSQIGFSLQGITQVPLILKLRPSLDIVWNLTLPQEGEAKGILQLQNGDYAVVGQLDYRPNNTVALGDTTQAFIARLSDPAVVRWLTRLNVYHDTFVDVREAGTQLLALGQHNNPITKADGLLARYNLSDGTQSGDVQLLGNRYFNAFYQLAPTHTAGAWLCVGASELNTAGKRNMYLVKTN